MGRGSSKAGGNRQIPTKATQIENMNEAQIDLEIRKTEKTIERLQGEKDRLSPSAEETALREAFPLGAGGFSRSDADRLAGRLGEQAANRARKYVDADNKQKSAETRLKNLQSAKKTVKGTGKTSKQIRDEKQKANTAASTRKWKVTQKQEQTGSSLKPRIISSGDYEIRGKSVLRIYKNGKQIGQATNLAQAKSFVEKFDK